MAGQKCEIKTLTRKTGENGEIVTKFIFFNMLSNKQFRALLLESLGNRGKLRMSVTAA